LQVQQKYSVSAQKANSFMDTENKLAKVLLLVLWSYVCKIHKQEHVGGFVIVSAEQSRIIFYLFILHVL
jgi:hypothetical protein